MSADRTVACTIVARNYLAQARVWADSIREHDRDIRLFLLVLDEPYGTAWPELESLGLEVLTVGEIGLPRVEAFVFRYGVTELATAVKPWLLAELFERCEPEFLHYFDPDVVCLASPTVLNKHLKGADLALTPHLLFEGGTREPEMERIILACGAYNLGYLGLRRTPATRNALRWWRQRLERECVNEVERGYFVDQKWLNLISGLPIVMRVIRERGCNVAYWNLHERTLEQSDRGWIVDGGPLIFFHFSGYSPLSADRISQYQPHLSLRDHSALRPLFYQYCERLAQHGFAEASRIPYGFGAFSDGTPIPRELRRLFAEEDERTPARWPDPRVVVDRDSFAVWAIAEDPLGGAGSCPLARFVWRMRADLRAAFPNPFSSPSDEERFSTWFHARAGVEYGIPESWFRIAALAPRIRRSVSSTLKRVGLKDGTDQAAIEAIEWLLARIEKEPSATAACSLGEFQEAVERLIESAPDAFRSILEPWICGRPLERVWRWYSSRVDAHERFQSPWETREREELLRWMAIEGAQAGLAAEDLALFEAALAQSSERAFAWTYLHNTVLRRSHGRLDVTGSRPSESLRPASFPGLPCTEAFGANFVGFYDAFSGVGEAGRSTLESAWAAKIPAAVETIPVIPSAQTPFLSRHDPLRYPVTVFNVNAENMLWGWGNVLADLLRNTYRIGCWFWELEHFPEEQQAALGFVDEIWARSSFMAGAFRAATDKPVIYLPLGVRELSAPRGNLRGRYGFHPGQVVFLTSVDALSYLERKNPIGAVDAFRLAGFSPEEAKLVVKTVNASEDKVRTLYERAGRANVLILSESMQREEYLELVASVDAIVSLHRSEGFGLPLAEAMALGRPVIATAYGGNMDFTTRESAFLIGYRLVRLPDPVGPYPAGARWAEPDLASAAEAMRAVVRNRAAAQEKAECGRALIRMQHGHERVGLLLRKRLREVWAMRASRRPGSVGSVGGSPAYH